MKTKLSLSGDSLRTWHVRTDESASCPITTKTMSSIRTQGERYQVVVLHTAHYGPECQQDFWSHYLESAQSAARIMRDKYSDAIVRIYDHFPSRVEF